MRALVIVYSNYAKLLVVNYLPMQNLLSDAEILEDVYEDVLGGDFADYGAEAVDG